MAEFPALPIFTDAYLSDTRHLNAAQHGAYLLLLMMAWRMPDCALPDDDEVLARWCSMDKRTFVKNKSVIMSFWTRNNAGQFVQKRLLDERKYVEQLRSKNVAAGRASALKRLNRGSTTVQPKVNETSTPTPTPTPIPIPSNKSLTTEIVNNKPSSRGLRLKAYLATVDENETGKIWGNWALEQGMSVEEVRSEMAKFQDYWNSTTKNAAKLDWLATWRNWIRTAIDRKSTQGANNGFHRR